MRISSPFNLIRWILFISALHGLMACAPTGATKNISPRPPVSPPVVNPHGFQAQLGLISGSQQAQTTPLGYKSFGSVGEPTSGIQQTTPLGYKALISVQGNVAAE